MRQGREEVVRCLPRLRFEIAEGDDLPVHVERTGVGRENQAVRDSAVLVRAPFQSVISNGILLRVDSGLRQ
jgi:hypothetical protein